MCFVTSLSGLERGEGHIHTVLSPTLQVALGIDYVMLVKAAFGVVQAQPTIWQFFTYVLRVFFPPLEKTESIKYLSPCLYSTIT